MNKVYRSIAIAVITGISSLSAQTTPTPWNLNSSGNYSFTSFSPTANSLPAGMAIHQMNTSPVTLSSTPASDIPLPCPQTSAANTNVWGLDAQGLGIRSNPVSASTGYQNGKLGEVVVAVNTTSRTHVNVSFKAGTYQQGTGQSAVFKLRCQYRVGSSGSWLELPGGPAEYQTILAIDSVNMGPYALPSSVDNQAVVQIRWVYYFVSGTWTSSNNRTHRARLDDISITSLPIVSQSAFATVCPTSSKFTLTGGSPAGGTYSGSGVSGNQFDPSMSGVGTFPITYSYTDAYGMTNSAIQNITVDYNGCVTQLNSASCGSTESTLNQNLHIDPVTGATNYKYEITDNTNGSIYTFIRGNSLTNFRCDWISGIAYGKTYSVRVATYINNAWRPYGNICSVTTPTPPATELASNSCGVAVTDLNTRLYCDPVVGASNYRYEITDSATGVVTTYVRGNSLTTMQFNWIPGTNYSKTYQIRVAACVGGIWHSYGPMCKVITPIVPATQLTSSSCGITETTLSDVLYCLPVAGASDFRYKVVDLSNGNTFVRVRGTNMYNFQLNWITGVGYGKTYSISVASYVSGVWSSYGPACSVTTPAVPTTQLSSSSCGVTISSLTTPLYVDPVVGATDYRYGITDMSTGTVTYYARNNNSTNLQLSWITSMSMGKTYSIRAAAYVGGTWLAFGSACTVTTSSGARIANNSTDDVLKNSSADLGEDVTFKLYPNPNEGAFILQVEKGSTVTVTDVPGAKVYTGIMTETISSLNLESIKPGIYFVEMENGNTHSVIRMIRQ